jgi:hypothetical protein
MLQSFRAGFEERKGHLRKTIKRNKGGEEVTGNRIKKASEEKYQDKR